MCLYSSNLTRIHPLRISGQTFEVSIPLTLKKEQHGQFGSRKKYSGVCCKRPFRDSVPLYLHSQVFQDCFLCGFIENQCMFLSLPCLFPLLLWKRLDFDGITYWCMCRNTGPGDVYLKVMCCGICHTDIHQIKNDLGMSNYPMVPGYHLSPSCVCVCV